MEKKYKIVITYDTGDSFRHRCGETDYLDLTFNDLNKAKQALKDIEEHYKLYLDCKQNLFSDKKSIQKTKNKAMKKAWFYKGRYKEDYQHALLLENDEGERIEERCFWIGHFETLVGGDIETVNDGMSFTV